MNKISISVKNNMTYDDLEKSYLVIQDHENVDLKIPKELKYKGFGNLGEIFQLIINWSKKSKGVVLTNLENDNQTEIDAYFSKYHNFIAGCLSYHKGIYSKHGVNISKHVALVLKNNIQRIENESGWKKGDNLFLPCIQHSATPFPSSLYNTNKELLDKREFFDLLEKSLKKIATNRKISTDVERISSNKISLGKIVYELIENTHKWGQSDHNDKGILKGVRGLYLSSFIGSKELLEKNAKDSIPLINYFGHNEFSSKENQFIEITVFDSGPGLASKWLKKDTNSLTDKEDVHNAIIDCLVIEKSSSQISNYGRGYGFYHIHEILKNTGFLKITCNGMRLYRDFIESPFDLKERHNRSSYFLNSWSDNSQTLIPKHGTVCTIIFPLN